MLTHNGVMSPKKEGNIQICMLNCQNKVMRAYVIIKNPKTHTTNVWKQYIFL